MDVGGDRTKVLIDLIIKYSVRHGPSVTVTSHTTRASVLVLVLVPAVDPSALGTIEASMMERRSPIDPPYTFGRAMTSCRTASSICLTLGGRLPLMLRLLLVVVSGGAAAAAGPGELEEEEGFGLLSKGRAIKDRGRWCLGGDGDEGAEER